MFRAVFTWLSKRIGFGFGFTTPFSWLVYLLWFWFYDSQVKTALIALLAFTWICFLLNRICTRLRVVPIFPQEFYRERKRECAWKSPHARKARRGSVLFFSLLSASRLYIAWGDFHVRSRLARSTIPLGKMRTICSLNLHRPPIKIKSILASYFFPMSLRTKNVKFHFWCGTKPHHWKMRLGMIVTAFPVASPKTLNSTMHRINHYPADKY